jgi:thiol-disulfide isomerase/thioredoxin
MKIAVALVGLAVLAIVGVVAIREGGHRGYDSNPVAFALPALDGSQHVTLAGFRGTPVVVNLFASWCAECQVELPAFARASARLRGRVQFVGIDSMETGDGRAMAAQYHLAENGFVLAKDVGAGGSALHDALRAPGMPVTIFYDASGRIVGRDIASLPEATLTAQLRQYYGV